MITKDDILVTTNQRVIWDSDEDCNYKYLFICLVTWLDKNIEKKYMRDWGRKRKARRPIYTWVNILFEVLFMTNEFPTKTKYTFFDDVKLLNFACHFVDTISWVIEMVRVVIDLITGL